MHICADISLKIGRKGRIIQCNVIEIVLDCYCLYIWFKGVTVSVCSYNLSKMCCCFIKLWKTFARRSDMFYRKQRKLFLNDLTSNECLQYIFVPCD